MNHNLKMSMRIKSFFIFAASVLVTSYTNAEEISFVVKKITDRVYSAHPSKLPRVNSTSTIIIGKSFLTVVESQADVVQARALIKVIRQQVSKLPIRYLILTHLHLDHTLGVAAFQEENPGVIVIAHPNTNTYILNEAQQAKLDWMKVINDISEREKNNGNSQGAASLLKYKADVEKSPIIQPDLLVSTELEIRDEVTPFWIFHIGSGHTNSDLLVYIPKDKILITGDLVHDLEPLFWNSPDPDAWLVTLRKIRDIDFIMLVGGHGDIQEGKDILIHWTNYMQEIIDLTKEGLHDKKDLKDVLATIPQSLHTLQQDGYGDRIQQHRTAIMDLIPGTLSEAVKSEVENLWRIYENKK